VRVKRPRGVWLRLADRPEAIFEIGFRNERVESRLDVHQSENLA